MDKTQLVNRILDNLAWATSVGEPPSPVRSAELWPEIVKLWSRSDEEFVRGLYILLLKKEPDPEGLASFLHLLRSGGLRSEVIRRLSAREPSALCRIDPVWLEALPPQGLWVEVRRLWAEPSTTFVERLYQLLFQRQPEPEELTAHLAELADGQRRIDLIRKLVEAEPARARGLDTSWLTRLELLTADGLCDAVRRLWPTPVRVFIRGLYELLLHRAVDPRGLTIFVHQLERGGTRMELLRGIVNSEECRSHRLDTSWLGGFVANPPTEPGSPVGSPDHLAEQRSLRQRLLALKGPAEFIHQAYLSILDREPNPSEVHKHLGRIRLVPLYRHFFLHRLFAFQKRLNEQRQPQTRLAVTRLLLFLDDPQAFVRQAYRATVGRNPNSAESRKHLRRLRFVPFYRRLFLHRLFALKARI
jgi:hypothetical protein